MKKFLFGPCCGERFGGPLLLAFEIQKPRSERGGIEAVSWEELPEDVRHLLEQLKSGSHGPTEL